MTINPQRAALPYQRRPAAQRNREAPSLVETPPSVRRQGARLLLEERMIGTQTLKL